MARTILNSFSSSGGDFGGIDYISKSANYTASAGEGIIADTSSASWTLTLPASPSVGDRIGIIDPSDWSENNLIVARNGSTIEGLTENLICNLTGAKATLLYVGDTWTVDCTPGPGGVSENLIVSNHRYGNTASAITSVGFTSNHEGNNAATLQNNDGYDVSVDVFNVRDAWPTTYASNGRYSAPTPGGIVELLYNTDNHRFYAAMWYRPGVNSNVYYSNSTLAATMSVILLRDGWGDTNGFPYASQPVNLWYSGAPSGESNAPTSYLSFPFWSNATAPLTVAGAHGGNPTTTSLGCPHVPAGSRPNIIESFLRYNPNDAQRIIRSFVTEGWVFDGSANNQVIYEYVYKGTVKPDYSKLNSSSNIDTAYTLPGA